MKNKKLLFLGMPFFSLLFQVTLVQASGEMASVGNTKGSFGVVPSYQKDSPIKPIEGGSILEKEPPTDGPYSISYISEIDFGKQIIRNIDQTIYANNATITEEDSGIETEIQNFIQISDSSGSSNGWQLSATLDGPLKSETGKELKGLTFNFSHITVVPVGSDMNSDQRADNLIIPNTTVQLSDDEQQMVTIVEANKMNGQGRWHVMFGSSLEEGSESVFLTVPKGAVTEVGKYQTSLTWTFSDVK